MTYKDLQPGHILKTTFGNDLDRVYHVRAIVDGRLVLRFWSKSKQRWEYIVEGPEWFVVFRSNLKISREPFEEDYYADDALRSIGAL